MTPEDPEDPEAPEGLEAVKLMLTWDHDAHPPTVYANHLLVSQAGKEVYFYFGEFSPPPVLRGDSTEDFKRKYPDGLKIKVVAKIAVTKEMMSAFAEVVADVAKKVEEAKDHAPAG